MNLKYMLLLSVFYFYEIGNLLAIKQSFSNYEVEEKVADIPLEVDTLHCPQGCVCQYARFRDLPLSRWINYMQTRHGSESEQDASRNDANIDLSEIAAVSQWNDEEDRPITFSALDLTLNPYIKQATCIIQPEYNLAQLVQTLPHDLQALILLYTGVGSNKTIKTSELQPLNQLNTLEIRGSQDCTLRLLLDAPLPFLLHANFECITLMGSENAQWPKSIKHPRDVFSYKPRGELLTWEYMDERQLDKVAQEPTLKKLNLQHATNMAQEAYDQVDVDIEILPYEVYKEEVKKARMPRFYGWQSLEILRINACELNELHWEMFIGLDALQHLVLEHNNIVVVPPYALFGAQHIRTLSLAHNLIRDLHYRDLAGLLQLEALDLSHNQLHKLSELTFPPFPKLQVADFRQNRIKYIFPAAFWVMNATRSMTFDAETVALELLSNAPFDTLRLLTNLYIGNIYVLILQQNMFKGLVSLRKLRLKGFIQTIEFDAFANLVSLRELDVSHCQLKEISMDAFIGVRHLEILNLSHNNLTYLPSGLFDEQPLLQQIYLQFNQLQTLPQNFFLQTHLKLAQLQDNPWQCSCDMSGWHPRITNKRSFSAQERCLTDYLTGKKYDCKKDYTYTMDRRMAPRCENFMGRSLYFVLRKQLRCDQKNPKKAYTPHWRKVESAKTKQGFHLKPTNGYLERKQFSNSLNYALQAHNANDKENLKAVENKVVDVYLDESLVSNDI